MSATLPLGASGSLTVGELLRDWRQRRHPLPPGTDDASLTAPAPAVVNEATAQALRLLAADAAGTAQAPTTA